MTGADFDEAVGVGVGVGVDFGAVDVAWQAVGWDASE